MHRVSCLGSERGGSRVYEWPPTSNAKLAFTAVVQLSLLPSSYVFSWVFASEALGGASSHVFICSPVSSPASGL